MADTFYRAFEERYRGSRDIIKSRLRAYHVFLDPLAALYPGAEALDVGCGRGEWLELLDEAGFMAQGVDLDDGMLAACRERGLRVERADALKTLSDLPADSLALVSAFHVVEHVPFDVLRAIVQEALRVLKPGGLLILETPNPENLVVGASDFYLDPSHERPIPPNLLGFVTEHAGFRRNKIVRLQEPEGLRDAKEIRLLNVLSGVSPDYSIVAQKAAPADILERFDGAFDTAYGLVLESLAQRYDAQGERRLHDIHRRIAENAEREEHHHADAVERAAQIEHRIGLLEARVVDAEAHIREAEARAAQYAERLLAVLQSRSWRITAPMRTLGGYARRLRDAVREGRIHSGIRRRVVVVLAATGRGIQRVPFLYRPLVAILNRFPGLRLRLHAMLKEPSAAAPATVAGPAGLSPRAAVVYTRLKNAVRSRQQH
jgi:O-antigen chain-terminating methyltransferase